MKKKVVIFSIIVFSFILVILCSALIYFNINLQPVDSGNKEEIEVIVPNGTIAAQVITLLKEKDLIKDEFVAKIYAKMSSLSFMAGRYVFTKAMGTKEILKDISVGNVTKDTIWITFVEGKRLTYIESQIASKFPYTKEEIHSVLEDRDYIKELISKYEILTDDILNEKIYHPLEGYLFTDTYEFEKNATIKDIVEKMISTLNIKMQKYMDDIKSSKYSIHEILTMASIVELESVSSDRKDVAGVFYNRLKSGWTLGSDITTYYAVNKDFDKELKRSEINSCNAYNTRGPCVKGLPAGPIASSSISAIEAAIYPSEHNYYYFVADANGKTYFSKTESEHTATIRKLQSEGLWYTY